MFVLRKGIFLLGFIGDGDVERIHGRKEKPMIVEIRDLVDGRLTTIAEKSNPYEVRITIGSIVYWLSDIGIGGLQVRASKAMRFVPGAMNAIVIEGVDES